MRTKSSSKNRRKKRLVLGMALVCMAFNVMMIWRASSNDVPPLHVKITPTTLEENSLSSTSYDQDHPDHRRRNRRRYLTMPPQESSEHTVGFIHVGKTAGSTISQLLRNGCTSFIEGPCRTNIPNESQISKVVEHYYHVPDFHRLPTTNHYAYIMTVRDVYERTISSFLYHHPQNAMIHQVKLTMNHQELGPKAYSCFHTLDKFAIQLNGMSNSNQCDYPYPHNVIKTVNCSALACGALHGKVRFFIHLFFNYRNLYDMKFPTDTTRQLYVIRQEFLWRDWKQLNIHFGQTTPVYIPPTDFNQRNITGMSLPVDKKMSSHGRQLLCTSLREEYEAYFRILLRSKNLGPDDFEASLQISEKQCPNLDLRAMVDRLK